MEKGSRVFREERCKTKNIKIPKEGRTAGFVMVPGGPAHHMTGGTGASGSGDTAVTCAKIDSCQKVLSLRSHDWAGDWQLAEAIREMCSKCKELLGYVEFWEKWHEAGELEKVELVETLILPSRKLKGHDYEHHCAALMNSYLVDLADYMQRVGGNI